MRGDKHGWIFAHIIKMKHQLIHPHPMLQIASSPEKFARMQVNTSSEVLRKIQLALAQNTDRHIPLSMIRGNIIIVR